MQETTINSYPVEVLEIHNEFNTAADKLLEEANQILKEGKKDNFKNFKNRLIKNYAQFGICTLYLNKKLINVSSKKYIKKYAKTCSFGDINLFSPPGYWFKIPLLAKTKKEAVDLIKKRMEILKKW